MLLRAMQMEMGYFRLAYGSVTCPNGHILDRDINAAKNILEKGLKIIGADLSDHTDGGLHKPSEKKHKPVKSEAHMSLACA
jgi:putative transposase